MFRSRLRRSHETHLNLVKNVEKSRNFPLFAVGARKIDDFFVLFVLNAPNLVLKMQKIAIFLLVVQKKFV